MNVWIQYLYWAGEYPKGLDDAGCSKFQDPDSEAEQVLIAISNHSENYREKKNTINVVEDCSHCDLRRTENGSHLLKAMGHEK